MGYTLMKLIMGKKISLKDRINRIPSSWGLVGITALLVFVFYSQLFPFTLWRMSGDNLFVMTPDFLDAVLTGPAGVSEFIGLWLTQAYGEVIVGIVVHTLLLVFISLAAYY